MTDTRHGMTDTRHGMTDTRHGMTDTRDGMTDTRHGMTDTRHGTTGIRHGTTGGFEQRKLEGEGVFDAPPSPAENKKSPTRLSGRRWRFGG
jgi:hypothetical protein